LLALYGPAAGAAATSDVLGLLPGVGRVAENAAAVLAPAVATYTAVLIADTAIPAWHEAGRELPFVFVGGALASGGAIAMLHSPRAVSRAPPPFAVGGPVMELVASGVVARRVGRARPADHAP